MTHDESEHNEPEDKKVRSRSPTGSPAREPSDAATRVDFSMILASAVHDMKNSLGMLLHTMDELGAELSDEARESKKFNTLRYETERVHGDLLQLLGLYRIDVESLTANIEEHFVPDFLESQVARHVPLLDGHNITHKISTEDINGFFDADLVAGVLNNILNNAIRYTKTHVEIEARQQDDFLVLSVADDGEGYPAQMLNNQTTHPGTMNFSTGSTQLGLYFASAVARLHENAGNAGRICLYNGGRLNGGVFEIWLP